MAHQTRLDYLKFRDLAPRRPDIAAWRIQGDRGQRPRQGASQPDRDPRFADQWLRFLRPASHRRGAQARHLGGTPSVALRLERSAGVFRGGTGGAGMGRGADAHRRRRRRSRSGLRRPEGLLLRPRYRLHHVDGRSDQRIEPVWGRLPVHATGARLKAVTGSQSSSNFAVTIAVISFS